MPTSNPPERGISYEWINPPVRVPLADSEFNNVLAAARGMLQLVGIEEKFDILLANYAELERTLLQHSLDAMLRGPGDYADFREIHRSIAQRLSNLLSASRSYFDQACHDLGGKKTPGLSVDVNAMKSAAYDKSQSFRVLEALRNYSQHRGMPLQEVRFQMSWDKDADARSAVRFGVCVGLDVRALREDGFKANVADELLEQSSEFDLKFAIRQYVEAVGEVHDAVRLALADTQRRWMTDIESAVAKVTERAPVAERSLNISLYEIRGGEIEEIMWVSPKPGRYAQALQAKNSGLKNLSRRYVTSAIRESV